MDWPNEIQTIMKSRKLSLREFAKLVDMSPTFISDVMKGKPASPMLKLHVLDMRGYDLASQAVLKMLLSKEVAEKLVEKERDRGRSLVEARLAEKESRDDGAEARA